MFQTSHQINRVYLLWKYPSPRPYLTTKLGNPPVTPVSIHRPAHPVAVAVAWPDVGPADVPASFSRFRSFV